MLLILKVSFSFVLFFTVITGIAYPLAVTVLAQALFPNQAGGSLVTRAGTVVGSQNIGQKFSAPEYFWGRPSAAGKDGYDASFSSGSNLGPTNRTLMDDINKRAIGVRRDNNLGENSIIPADLVTMSASGLDPDISPASAYLQVERISRQRNIPTDHIRELIGAHTSDSGFLGGAGINILLLNLALDSGQIPYSSR